jgi:hypothetical protein
MGDASCDVKCLVHLYCQVSLTEYHVETVWVICSSYCRYFQTRGLVLVFVFHHCSAALKFVSLIRRYFYETFLQLHHHLMACHSVVHTTVHARLSTRLVSEILFVSLMTG